MKTERGEEPASFEATQPARLGAATGAVQGVNRRDNDFAKTGPITAYGMDSATADVGREPIALQIGRWRIDIVSGGTFRTDGGVLFGMVPKTVWQGIVTPDQLNRCMVATNCILARDGRDVVLIDTGYGGKYAPLDRKVHDFEAGEPLLASLRECGVAPQDVTHVIFSHLHFDHAGGATRYDDKRRIVPTFPRAQHWVHRWEWDDATSNSPETRAGYPMQNFLPLADANLIKLYESDGELLPGLRMQLTGGHTRGHQAIWFESADSSLLYVGDICPSSAHIRPQWHTAYEQFPLCTRAIKPKILAEAADRHSQIVWNHDPFIPVSRVARHATREFVIVDAYGTSACSSSQLGPSP
jgi:glyoxylase-like metal-dependent hydrolase (beta-lactamase superfamily II)